MIQCNALVDGNMSRRAITSTQKKEILVRFYRVWLGDKNKHLRLGQLLYNVFGKTLLPKDLEELKKNGALAHIDIHGVEDYDLIEQMEAYTRSTQKEDSN